MAHRIKKVVLPATIFALLGICTLALPPFASTQGPDETDGPIGPTGIVVDADDAQEGDVLAEGEKVDEGCDFGNQVNEVQIVGVPAWPEKAQMHVSVGPNEDCELIVAEVLWKASTNEESQQGSGNPAGPHGPGGDDGPVGDTGASATATTIDAHTYRPGRAVNLKLLAKHSAGPSRNLETLASSGSVEYEAWARGWWRDGVYLRITEAYVDYVYNKTGSSLSFEGTHDYECDELSTHWRTRECESGVLPKTTSSIGRYVRGNFRTIAPIDGIHPLMASHTIKTDLTARTGGIHIRCVSSHEVPHTGVWPFVTTFECDGELQRND